MTSFSDFAKNFKPSEGDKKFDQQKKVEENVNSTYEKYKDFSKDQLMSELLKKTSEQKENGEFDYETLKSQVDMLSSYLSEEQKNNMYSLLEKIK